MTRLLKHKTSVEVSVFKYLIILIILISTAVVTKTYYDNQTSVTFVELPDNITYTIDHAKQLYLSEPGLFNSKKSSNMLYAGSHIIHYDTSPVTRYYALFNVKKGENYIKPVFDFHSLPSLSIFRLYTKKASGKIKNSKTFNYITHAENNATFQNSITISIGLEIKKTKTDFLCQYNWDVSLNGHRISQKTFTEYDNTINNQEPIREIIYKNGSHYYYAEHFLENGSAKLKIGAEYL